MNQQILAIGQIATGVLLSVLILLQQRGGGVGIIGGLSSQFYGARRGLEKSIFFATIFLGAIFIALAIISFLI